MQIGNHIQYPDEQPQYDSQRQPHNQETYTEQDTYQTGDQRLSPEIAVHTLLYIIPYRDEHRPVFLRYHTLEPTQYPVIIEDVFIVPRVMGKVTGLNPAIILLSLSIWGTLLGFVGMIIALPLTTLCLSYYQRYVIGADSVEPPDSPTDTSVSEEAQE